MTAESVLLKRPVLRCTAALFSSLSYFRPIFILFQNLVCSNIFQQMKHLGRKSGQHVVAAASGSSPSYGSYSRYMQHQVLTHQDAEATEDATDLAHQLYDEIAGKHSGGVKFTLCVKLKVIFGLACQRHDLAVTRAGDRSYVTGSIRGWSRSHWTYIPGGC